MKQRHDAILFVLDETGSMDMVRDATISAFNEFLKGQKMEGRTCEVFFMPFNSEYRAKGFKVTKKPLAELPMLSRETYVPTAVTPLYDAVGHMIKFAGEDFSNRQEHERPEKVIMAIQTDGQENASSEYTAQQVRKMIEHQKTSYNWQFVFLGANQDAWLAAADFGIPKVQSLSYDNTDRGVAAAMALTGDAYTNYRSGKTSTACFVDSDIRGNN